MKALLHGGGVFALVAMAASCTDVAPIPAPTLGSLAVTPKAVAIDGIRVHTEVSNGVSSSVRERVVTGADGSVTLELLEVDGLTQAQFEAGAVLHLWARVANAYAARGSFFARYRDFAVADAALVLENYAIELSPLTGSLFGRPTGHAVFHRPGGGRSHDVTWDLATGVVLDAKEIAADGTLLARTQYESISFASGSAAAPAEDEPAAAPAPNHRPRTLPAGFRLRREFGVAAANGPSVRVEHFTDGIEHLFFTETVVAAPSGGSSAAVAAPASPEVRRVRFGLVELLETDAPGAVLTVSGKLATDDLKLVLASALP